MSRIKNRTYVNTAITFFILFLQIGFVRFSAAQNLKYFTEENSQNIEFPYQLTFIHENPKNKVDSLVIELLKYDYRQENGIVKHKILDNIAKTKTREAFYLLYVGCLSQPRTDNYFAPFQQLCYTIKNNGGLQLLNNYFLNRSVKESGSEKDIENEIIKRCKKKKPAISYYLNIPQEINMDEIQEEIKQFRIQNKPCIRPQLLTKKNLKNVKQVYELTFLHEQPLNTVDSCVRFLLDSIDWRVKKNWHLVYDSIWNRIAQTKSTEALQLLYLASWDEVSPYNEHLYVLTNWLYPKVDNYLYKYFYDGKKLKRDSIGSIGEFKVRKQILANIEEMAPQIYFCDEPTPQELYTKKVESGELKKMDRKIIKLIKRNRKFKKPTSGIELENKVKQLPFVNDVKLGNCYAVLDVLTTFYYTNIYTQLVVQDKLVERIYSIRNRRLLFVGIRLNKFPLGKLFHYSSKKYRYHSVYSYPALKDVRAYCERND